MTGPMPAVVVPCAACGGRLKLTRVRLIAQPDGTYSVDLMAGPMTAWTLHARYGCAPTPGWRKVVHAVTRRATGPA